jgi:hypothetical protein
MKNVLINYYSKLFGFELRIGPKGNKRNRKRYLESIPKAKLSYLDYG